MQKLTLGLDPGSKRFQDSFQPFHELSVNRFGKYECGGDK